MEFDIRRIKSADSLNYLIAMFLKIWWENADKKCWQILSVLQIIMYWATERRKEFKYDLVMALNSVVIPR